MQGALASRSCERAAAGLRAQRQQLCAARAGRPVAVVQRPCIVPQGWPRLASPWHRTVLHCTAAGSSGDGAEPSPAFEPVQTSLPSTSSSNSEGRSSDAATASTSSSSDASTSTAGESSAAAQSRQETDHTQASTLEALNRLTSPASTSSQPQPAASTATKEAPGAVPSSSAFPADSLKAVLLAPLAFLVSVWAALQAQLQRFPAWVKAQKLRRLKEQAEEEPLSAEKQAAYLNALNAAGSHREVLSRVEGRKFASSGAVVVEYLRALVESGRLQAYASASAAPGGPRPGEDHRSLPQLLRDLQSQAEGEAPDASPGASVRRPLHVTIQGGSVAAFNKPTGPWQILWSLLSTALLLVGLSFAWLVGSQVARRAQSGQGLGSGAMSASSSASSGMSAAAGGAPAMEPKEYKKEELPEASVKTFKDVVGCDESKAELEEVVEFLKHPAKFTRLGAKLPKGVLLTGPPGTGKTLLAKAVAGEAGVPFFYRAGSEFEELYVGVGSRRMRALFAAAKKKAPCVVFIDEIDAIGGNRKHWENHTRKTLNQLLVEMDGFESNEGVIVMAATNVPETLDPALKRPGRFDRMVAVPLPDIKGRTELLQYYLQDKPAAADINAKLIARQTGGFSGADLANLINEAALLAAKRGADFIDASMVDYAWDKIRMGVERKSAVRSPESLKRTAYHESGHAIVALNTPGASPIHKATIVPRGHALGMVTQVGREDEFSVNRQQMVARIRVCMGGQVAEELIFGRDQVTSGASDDLRQATDMARHMVTQCGLSDAIGPIYVEDEKLLGESLKQQIDTEVRTMLQEARDGVVKLLTDKRADLHTLANALLSHETLTRTDIDKVLRGEELEAADSVGVMIGDDSVAEDAATVAARDGR